MREGVVERDTLAGLVGEHRVDQVEQLNVVRLLQTQVALKCASSEIVIVFCVKKPRCLQQSQESL